MTKTVRLSTGVLFLLMSGVVAALAGCGSSGGGADGPLPIAERIEKAKAQSDPVSRATELVRIAREQQESGGIEGIDEAMYHAEQACNQIENQRRRVEILTELAALNEAEGNKSKSRDMLKDIQLSLERITDPLERVSAVTSFAPVYATEFNRRSAAEGLLDEVVGVVDAIEDPVFQVAALADIAAAYSRLEDDARRDEILQLAFEKAAAHEDPRGRTDSLVELARRYHALELDEADRVFDEAASAAASIEEAKSRAFAQINLAKSLLDSGRAAKATTAFNQAEQAAALISEQSSKNLVMRELDRLRDRF